MSKRRIKHISTLGSQLTSIISVTLVLVLLGLTALGGIAVRSLTDDVRRNLGFTVKMKNDVNDGELNEMKRFLAEAPFCESYVYLSAESIMEEESRSMGENIYELLDTNPFSAEFDVVLVRDYANADSIAALSERLPAVAGVDEVLTEGAVIADVDTAFNRLRIVLLTVSGALLLISFVLINNTVSLSIYSRRFLIHTMKLVGATAGFIRRPFIRAGAASGLAAGLAASAILIGLRAYVGNIDPAIAYGLTPATMASVSGGIIITGVIICAGASMIAANRYLRLGYDDMFRK